MTAGPAARVAGVVSVVVFVLSMTGCADGDEPVDLRGVELTVGSRDFPEQRLLSEILIQSAARAGAEVTDATDTGDLDETRRALLDGDIDAYWEYNSAVWVEAMGNEPDPDLDGEEITDAVREADGENGIRWIGRSSFDNTYGFALSHEQAEDHQASRYSIDAFDLDALADLVEDESDLVVCVEPEFVERADGLARFEEATGTTIPDDQLRVLDDIGEVYPALAEDDCDVGEVFTTSGQLARYDLTVIENGGVFLEYQASLTIRDEAYQQAPDDIDALVDDILSALSTARIRELNRRVADGEDIAEVADDFVDEFVANVVA